MRVYEVELLVVGAISCNAMKFNTDKELSFGDVFHSDIKIKPHKNGVRLTTTVYTESTERAYMVAVLFVGRMLDVLSFRTNTSLYIESPDYIAKVEKNDIRVMITRWEFDYCFSQSRYLNLSQSTVLRALNWYRKGLYTDDPIDKFLAYWNSIGVIAGKFFNRNERTERGIKNQIYDCFTTLWGDDQKKWEYINGESQWIDRHNDMRNDIAHGLLPIEIDYIQRVISTVERVQQVAYKFIGEWSSSQLTINLHKDEFGLED